jgi:hypothetical protein
MPDRNTHPKIDADELRTALLAKVASLSGGGDVVVTPSPKGLTTS